MEPRVFTIVLEGNWDGMTPVVRTRDDLATDAQGRNYRLELTGPAGVLTGDFFQVFSAATPKIVGIASAFYNPQDVAAVFRDDPILAVRQQINITPLVHYVVMMPGDKLAIATKDSGRSMITLVVNELTEGDAIQAAFRCPPEEQWRRFRILRSDGQGFSPTGGAWEPDFQWSVASNLLEVTANTNGPIPVQKLCLYPRFEGCYISIRYAGLAASDKGSLHIVEPVTSTSWRAQQNLRNVRWSRVQFVSHNDMIGLQTPAPPAGKNVLVDIELTRVRGRDRLSGRYAAGQ